MKRNFTLIIIFIFLFSFIMFSGCSNHGLDPKNPVTITLWHNYGAQMKESMDEMVDVFNETIGVEKGIIINVTSISSSSALDDKLTMAANGDPGAPTLPEITTCYPKTAILLEEKDLLVNLDEYFTNKEISAYIPRFIEEGQLNKHLYVFPTAKSTEVIFVNKTIFDRFAADTGATINDLSTFEGLVKTAEKYYIWTDAKTQDISNDGKAFFYFDSLYNFAQIGCAQLGETFVTESGLNFKSEAFSKVWHTYYDSAVQGYAYATNSFKGYGSDLTKTGDVVCSIGSTAGAPFFIPSVTYADNTTENAEFVILPYPVFEGGQKIAMQRGGGMCIIRSNEQKQYAASLFLKWFTQPENNLNFVATTGYLPVTNEAYGKRMGQQIDTISDATIKKLLTTAIEMQNDYDFYIPPVFENITTLEKNFNINFKQYAVDSKSNYISLLKTMDSNTAFKESTKNAFDNFSK